MDGKRIMDMDNYDFSLEYSCTKEIDKELFLNDESNLPFDSNSKEQMRVMMSEIAKCLNLTEEYTLRKLEVVLRYELPFFATNRRLVKNWLMDNFIY